MRCYAPDPARGANSTPPNFLAGFGGRGKGVTVGKREREKKERASGKRNGKEKKRKGKQGRKGEGTKEILGGGIERERKEGKGKKGKGGILCSCDFSLRKTLRLTRAYHAAALTSCSNDASDYQITLDTCFEFLQYQTILVRNDCIRFYRKQVLL